MELIDNFIWAWWPIHQLESCSKRLRQFHQIVFLFSVFFLLNWRIRISCDIWSLLSDNRIITSYSARSIYVRSLFSTPNERMRGVLSISPCLLALLFCNPALSPIFDKVDRCAIGFVFMVPHSLGRVRLIYSGFLIDGINPRSHLFWRSFHFNI